MEPLCALPAPTWLATCAEHNKHNSGRTEAMCREAEDVTGKMLEITPKRGCWIKRRHGRHIPPLSGVVPVAFIILGGEIIPQLIF